MQLSSKGNNSDLQHLMPDNLCSCSFITEKGTKTNREQEVLQLVTRAHPLPAAQQRVPAGQQWEQPMDNAALVALHCFYTLCRPVPAHTHSSEVHFQKDSNSAHGAVGCVVTILPATSWQAARAVTTHCSSQISSPALWDAAQDDERRMKLSHLCCCKN